MTLLEFIYTLRCINSLYQVLLRVYNPPDVTVQFRATSVFNLSDSTVHSAPTYSIIVNGKGNKQRVVPLGEVSKRSLNKYLGLIPFTGLEKPLFLKSDLKPIQASTIKQTFAKLKKRLKIGRLKPHLLRHTFATRYLENGGNIYNLQFILGHTSLEMVRRYVHLNTQKTIQSFSLFSPLDVLNKK